MPRFEVSGAGGAEFVPPRRGRRVVASVELVWSGIVGAMRPTRLRVGHAEDPIVHFRNELPQHRGDGRVIPGPAHLVAARPLDEAGMIAKLLDEADGGPLHGGRVCGILLRPAFAGIGGWHFLLDHDAQLVGQVVPLIPQGDAGPVSHHVHSRLVRHPQQPVGLGVLTSGEQVNRNNVGAQQAHLAAIDHQLRPNGCVLGRSLPPAPT